MRYPLAFALLVASTSVVAQNEEDALRYSFTLPGGTARSWALGSAFGAVGADPASGSLNPAGFGLYNASEVSLTPVLESNNSEATRYGSTSSASQQRFAMNNMALVLNYPSGQGKPWRGGTFGLSFDRQASYYWKQNAQAGHVNSTILQQFVNESSGTSWSQVEGDAFPFTSSLAWWTYGIDTIPGDSTHYAPAIPFGSDVSQSHVVDASGRLNTTSIFYANNYMDRLYVGIAVGLVGLRFERHTTHTETTLDENIDLQKLTYKEDLLTTGNGIDVKVGAIGRVNDRLRFGASFHSPMWLSLNDSYSYKMTTAFRQGDGYVRDSPSGTFAYNIHTPWRVLLSGVYVVGKSGLVSVDYCYADYAQMRLRPSNTLADEYDFSTENTTIENSFTSTHSVRAGTEWRAGHWYFRGGWGIWPDPYNTNDSRHGTALQVFSGGVGYRSTHVSVDLAALFQTQRTQSYPYSADLISPTTDQLQSVRTLLTLAWRP